MSTACGHSQWARGQSHVDACGHDGQKPNFLVDIING